MKYLLIAGVLMLALRKPLEAQAEEEDQERGPEETFPPMLPERTGPEYFGSYLDEEYFGIPRDSSPGWITPPSDWPGGTFGDPVSPGGIQPGGIPTAGAGPGGPSTETELQAAGAAYNTVIANVYPGFTQLWQNTQNLANWQHTALDRNLSLASRAVNFHKRVLRKIF